MKYIAVLLLFLTSCFTNPEDFETGKRQLENQGYTEVYSTGYDNWCCDNKDNYSEGFHAKDRFGRPVEGCICSGNFKGVTIRFK
jgi:hypothetical protein